MTDAKAQQIGVVQVGQTMLGIPINHLSEVFHIRQEEELPQSSDLLRGGIALRGQLVPVLDLPKLGRLRYASGQPGFGVILEHENRLLGIFVDEIIGIAAVAADSFQTIVEQDATGTSVFCDHFEYRGQFVSVLDIAQVFALPDIHTVQRNNTIPMQTRRMHHPMLTFAAGGALYTVPAVEVYAAVHKQEIHQTAISIGPCLGEITYHGRRIPVLCPVQILGLGTRKTSHLTEVVALRFPGDLVLGFAVDAIHEIGTFPSAKETTLPIWQADRNFIERIIVRDDGAQIFAINLAAIHAADDLRDIASLSEVDVQEAPPVAILERPDETPVQGLSTEKERYLVVDAAERVAIPLAQVNCIVEPPKEFIATNLPRPGFLGYFSRSDESVALFDLAVLRGRAPLDVRSAKVVLSGAPGHQIGYMVARVVSIEMSEWREIGGAMEDGDNAPLVQLGAGPDATVLPICQLSTRATTAAHAAG